MGLSAMTQTTLETAPVTPHAVLLTMQWGDSHTARYCRWASNISDSGTFTAVPEMSVEFPEQGGGVEDQAVTITLPRSVEPVEHLIAGYAYARIAVTIEVCDPTDAASTRYTVYRGWVSLARANPAGRSGLVALECEGIKSLLKRRLGLRANTTCFNRLGDAGCGVDLDSFRVDAVVDSINVDGDPHRIKIVFEDDFDGFVSDHEGNFIDVGGCAVLVSDESGSGEITPEPPDLFYERGYVEIDGLRLMIRQDNGNGVFDLALRPPPSWVCTPCVVTPGCDKRLATCRAEYDNETNFAGYGIAIPIRNPMFENTPD